MHLDGKFETITGVCKGEITEAKHGEGEPGCAPIFKPTGFENTFAEMGLKLKKKIGHRRKAIKQFIIFLEHC